MGRDGVATGGGVGGLDLGGRIFPNDLASSVDRVPDIAEPVLGIEVAGLHGCRDEFPHNDFVRLHGAVSRRGLRKRTTRNQRDR